MGIKIVKSNETILTENLIVVLFGQPGIGKTSLACSADKPLVLDFDGGVQRAIGRQDAIRITKWDDVAELSDDDLAAYNTIVIDTVGRCLEILAQDLGKRDPKFMRKTGELTLQGYGAIAVAFKAWINTIKSFGKDIVLIGHDKEDKNGDNLYVRIDVIGSTKQEIYKMADILGYISTKNGNRTIDFNPTDDHLGKNCPQFDILSIPTYSENKEYLHWIITESKNRMNKLSEEQIIAQKNFDAALELINQANTVEDFNGFLSVEYMIKNQALKAQFHKFATAKNFIYNTATKQYEDKNIKPETTELVSDLDFSDIAKS